MFKILFLRISAHNRETTDVVTENLDKKTKKFQLSRNRGLINRRVVLHITSWWSLNKILK